MKSPAVITGSHLELHHRSPRSAPMATPAAIESCCATLTSEVARLMPACLDVGVGRRHNRSRRHSRTARPP